MTTVRKDAPSAPSQSSVPPGRSAPSQSSVPPGPSAPRSPHAAHAASRARPAFATRATRCVTLLTLLVGGSAIAYGGWIPIKARVAQLLLLRAWQEAQGAPPGQVHKPWPWADTWPVARLHLPGEGQPLVVLAGISGQSMAFGPGLRYGERPDVGSERNLVLAGHRDTHFAPLEHMTRGQILSLELAGQRPRRYRVVRTAVVHRKQSWPLAEPAADSQQITLVTCFPFRSLLPGGPLRWVVQAERLEAG